MRFFALIIIVVAGYLLYTGGISINDSAVSDLKHGAKKVFDAGTKSETAKKIGEQAGKIVKEVLK